MSSEVNELRQALRAALEWIDAVPADVAASLPTMPGFSRDWVEDLLSGVREPLALPQRWRARKGQHLCGDAETVMIPDGRGDWLSVYDVERLLLAAGVLVRE